MSYIVEIRRNTDGLTKQIMQPFEWKEDIDGGSSLFWWTEGNMGCDCNRELLFEDRDVDDDELVCGITKYAVLRIILPDGREIKVDEP